MRRWILSSFALLVISAPHLLVAQDLIPPAQPFGFQPSDVPPPAPGDVSFRLRALEEQLRQLKQESTATPPNPSGDPVDNSFLKEPGASEPKEELPAAPAYPNFKVTGFFQLDWGFYGQDALNRETLGDIEDGLGFRRARLAAVGDVAERTSYMMEFDFAQAVPRFSDVWMQFAETPLGNLRVGRFRQPFGMTEQTSIRELPFFERPTMFALSPFRQTGAMLFDTALDENVTWAIAGYRYLTDNFGNVYADNGGYGLATRVTSLLIDRGDDCLLHFGVDYSFNDPGRDLVQYASTNEFFVGQNPNLGPNGLSVLPIVSVPPFVNTGPIPTDNTNLFNLEGAASLGRALVQSEARWSVLEHLDGFTNTFPALYLHVRYMLTGETIPYSRTGGVFTRPKPKRPCNLRCGDCGAWEAAAGVSYIDLNGDSLPGPGRRLTNTTVGLNWYLNDRAKFQFDWIHSDLDDLTLGSSDAETLALRGQLDY